jgi:hypothetical protein
MNKLIVALAVMLATPTAAAGEGCSRGLAGTTTALPLSSEFDAAGWALPLCSASRAKPSAAKEAASAYPATLIACPSKGALRRLFRVALVRPGADGISVCSTFPVSGLTASWDCIGELDVFPEVGSASSIPVFETCLDGRRLVGTPPAAIDEHYSDPDLDVEVPLGAGLQPGVFYFPCGEPEDLPVEQRIASM